MEVTIEETCHLEVRVCFASSENAHAHAILTAHRQDLKTLSGKKPLEDADVGTSLCALTEQEIQRDSWPPSSR